MSELIGQCGFLGVVRVRYVIAMDHGAGLKRLLLAQMSMQFRKGVPSAALRCCVRRMSAIVEAVSVLRLHFWQTT